MILKSVQTPRGVILNVSEQEAREVFGATEEAIATARAKVIAEEARRLAGEHINKYYPTYKQLNLLRSGTKAEKDKMDTFINACRDWSNGENPDPAALEAIQP